MNDPEKDYCIRVAQEKISGVHINKSTEKQNNDLNSLI